MPHKSQAHWKVTLAITQPKPAKELCLANTRIRNKARNANTRYSQKGFQWYSKVSRLFQSFMYLDKKSLGMAILSTLATIPT